MVVRLVSVTFRIITGILPWLSLSTVLIVLAEQVTGGTVKVNLDIDKIPFISLNLDLCELLSDAGLSCPVSAGPQTLTVSQEIPDEAPSVIKIA